jgi:hypothetical protein
MSNQTTESQTKIEGKPWEVKAPKDLTEEEQMQYFESIWGTPNDRGLQSSTLQEVKSVFSPKSMKDKYQEIIDLVQSGKALDKNKQPGGKTAMFDFNGYRYGATKFDDGRFGVWRRQITGGKSGGPKDYYRLAGLYVGPASNIQAFLDEHQTEFWNYQESFDDKESGERMYVLVRRQKWIPQGQQSGDGQANQSSGGGNED